MTSARTALFLLVAAAPSTALAKRVAVLGSDFGPERNDVVSKLIADGRFCEVANYDLSTSPGPSAAELAGFDAVIVWRNIPLLDPVGVGDLLADYVDGGGTVVETMFAFEADSLEGRFITDGYRAKSEGGTNVICPGDMVILDAADPIFAGVSSYAWNEASCFHTPNSTPDNGASELAVFLDGSTANGGTMVAAHAPTGAGRVIALNFPAVSADVPGYHESWDSASDAGLIIANALDDTLTDTVCPASDFEITLTGTCPGPVTLAVAGATPGGTVRAGTAPGLGASTVSSGSCAGLALDIGPWASPAAQAVVDADGTASWSFDVPAARCGEVTQVIDRATCTTSNVETF